MPDSSVQPQRLECSLVKVNIEDRINVLEDVEVHLKELALILNGDEGSLGAVAHGDLVSDRTGFTLPWRVMSPRTSRPSCGG